MTQKKLVIFIPSIEGGGVEKNLFIISNFLIKKINKLSIITTSHKSKKKFKKGINIILPKYKFWDNLSRIYKYFICLLILFKYLISNKNSTVLAFQANLYCVIICKILSVKVIVRSNSDPAGWANNLIKRHTYKFLINKSDKVIVNSIDFKHKMKKKFNVNSQVIYNPLNKVEVVKKSKLIKKSFYPKKCLKIINIGRLVDQKDHLTLLKSLNLIKNKINFHAIIMGSGILKDELIKYIKKQNLSNCVKLISYKKNPYPFINQADLFILSSKYEGLPNVLLEAIALKKYVISSNCPSGPREILLNGKGGGLFPIGDYKHLSKLILLFKKNTIKNNASINLAYKKLNRFDLKKNLEKYYNEIIDLM